ncbi:MAG: UDP-N-acetylmuramoyl-L-alanine--D-glutamate ligase [candidate division WOR-3 bacterium]
MKKIAQTDKQKPKRNRIAILGLGRVGKLVAKYLLNKGEEVYIYDDNPEIFQNKDIRQFIQNPNCVVMTKKTARLVANQIVLAICSPGIGPKNPVVKILARSKIPVIDEIDFTSLEITRVAFSNHQFISHKPIIALSPNTTISSYYSFISKNKIDFSKTLKINLGASPKIIAITGTNGKSTATVLLGKILSTAGKRIFYGGNLAPGLPFAQVLFEPLQDYYVIEVSSFQLERSFYFHPHIAILLNITPDHLNRHQTLKQYREIKFRIFANQSSKDYAIINADDNAITVYTDKIRSRIFYFSRNHKTNGAYLDGDNIYFQDEKICSRRDIKLLGEHYWDSVLAVITAAKFLKIDNKSIVEVLKKFQGLEHRLEYVRTIGGVKYINNSMCTNPAAGVAALNVFSEPMVLITGGAEKKLNVKEYINTIVKKAKWTVLLGENRKRLALMLKNKGYFNFSLANSLKEAVMIAKNKAVRGDLILFSPGFASFDAFRDFQERGNAFKTIVNNL